MSKSIIIASDDPIALCTKEGWAREQARVRALRKKAKASEGDTDMAGARFWLASSKPSPSAKIATLFLETERMTDARAIAVRLLGGGDVDLVAIAAEQMPRLPTPRVQVRWVGNAARRVVDRRMQTRKVGKQGQLGRWEELR